ncbi:MAG: cbb3-type cytochrome c oxidase subunit II [Actinomycetota bacterium]|nr:cbb3-type cytochrome c oxidase subunit II [Actinomycetota bacterium]
MSDLLNKVAELLKAPVTLVQRSAEARATASGISVEDVLNSWLGGESVTVEEAKEEAPVEEVVTTVEEVVKLKEESSLTFILSVVFVGLFTYFFGFLTTGNQATALVEESLNNTIEISNEVYVGAQIYSELNCQSCHTQNVRALIPDTQNGKVLRNKYASEAVLKNVGNIRLGPDLSTNATREPTNNRQWLTRYLNDATSVNRDIPHPKYNFLQDQDMDYLVTYLLSLGEINE